MKNHVIPAGGDKNNGPEREIVYGLFLCIAIVVVSLRFYVRARMVKILWWDDFCLLLGTVRTLIEDNIAVC